MSNMELKVELLAGTSVKEAITEARQMARRLDVAYVKFAFNDVSFSVGQSADVEDAVRQYHERKTTFIIAA